MNGPSHVTLFVDRVTAVEVSARECLGDHCLYLREVRVPPGQTPRARAGERVRLSVAS
jgi:hypothetical protein